MRRFFRHELLRRSALFSLSIVASTVVGVFSLPVLITAVGATPWGHLVVMQAVTQFASVVIAFGWGATGPSMVSALVPTERKSVYFQSLQVRGALFLIVLPFAVWLCCTLTGESLLNAFLAFCTYGLSGLGAAWYFVGTNRPIALFLLDALPAILGQIVGLVAVSVTRELTAYLIWTALFAFAGAIAAAVYVLTRQNDGPTSLKATAQWGTVLHSQSAGVLSTVSASMWTSAPTVLVQAFAPSAVPVFAMVDRLMKYGVLALAPVLQAVQGWVPESGRESVAARAVTGLKVAAGVGVLGGATLACLSTPVSSLLSVGQAVVPWSLGVIAGVAFAFECLAQVAGLSGLVALGGARELAVSSIASALVGIPLIAALVLWLGLYGAVLGILVVGVSLAAYRVGYVLRYAARYE